MGLNSAPYRFSHDETRQDEPCQPYLDDAWQGGPNRPAAACLSAPRRRCPRRPRQGSAHPDAPSGLSSGHDGARLTKPDLTGLTRRTAADRAGQDSADQDLTRLPTPATTGQAGPRTPTGQDQAYPAKARLPLQASTRLRVACRYKPAVAGHASPSRDVPCRPRHGSTRHASTIQRFRDRGFHSGAARLHNRIPEAEPTR
jgi:hypothetical protein